MRILQGLGRHVTELLLLSLITIGLTALATTVTFADEALDDNTESYYANPAQAAHAAQLADEAAFSDDTVQVALNNYQEALDALAETPTVNELAHVSMLENTFRETLSDITGVMDDDIESMRASGMGWGEIAHELGVHPSALGLGHTKERNNFSQREVAEATARNTKNGFASGHGIGLQAGLSSSSQGKGKGNSSNAGGNKGDKGNTSNGKSGGNSSGNSGGHGGGDGGGNSGGNGGGNGGGGGGKK